jgi:hypothetical protein
VDAPCPPLNQALPAISGTADEGQTLSCSDGTWSGRGLAFSREWLRDGTPVAGATANSYLLTAADATHQVACRVTATDPDGTASATSAAVTPTAKPVPVVVPPKDTTPPTSTIVVPKQKLANVLKKGLKFTLSCNEPCTLTAVLKASYSAPKRSGKAAKTLTIATKRVTITKAGKVTVTFKFNKKAKKALAKIKKVKFTLTVTAKDGAGNTKRYTKSATLKRK